MITLLAGINVIDDKTEAKDIVVEVDLKDMIKIFPELMR